MTASTVTVLADSQHSFLTAPSFWNIVLIVGGILVIIGVITSDAGIIRKMIRLPIVVVGWIILWFMLMTAGSLVGGAAESFVNDDTNHPTSTTTPTSIPHQPTDTIDLNQLFLSTTPTPPK